MALRRFPVCLILASALATTALGQSNQGLRAEYQIEDQTALRASMVKSFTVTLGPSQPKEEQWTHLRAVKASGGQFQFWMLGGPFNTRDAISRYILQEGASVPREFRNPVTARAVLPSQGGWEHLFPQPVSVVEGTAEALPAKVLYLGHRYIRQRLVQNAEISLPSGIRLVELRPDMLVGPASNTRQKDESRRYDGSDYELIKLTRNDYREMWLAGVTCVNVNEEQSHWADELGLFYWGAGNSLPFPESIYRSQYIGPALFLDEPAVVTRDHVVRPRLAKDAEFRKSISPQLMLDDFRKYFESAWRDGTPTTLMKGFRARKDIDVGSMDFRQEDLYSWETMVSTAAHQLSQDPHVPQAIVFEPPGRIGTRRTLPEMDMTYGVQIPPDDPKALANIIFGFLRGAARLTGKQWGISIYGAFDRSDAPFWLTHAYDLGATRFFFWDNAGLACVPYPEVLAHARHLRDHARSHPRGDLTALRNAAAVAITLPAGYDLGHVQTGKGSMWGIGELNLDRINRAGASYRVVMSAFFTEIERCIKLGESFDLLWDLSAAPPANYREVVRIREDGKVDIDENGKQSVQPRARVPLRAPGAAPGLAVTVDAGPATDSAIEIKAKAQVTERAAPVFYTLGADRNGIYQNAVVAWELYGPGEEDYLFPLPPGLQPTVVANNNGATVYLNLKLTAPGRYRIRAATVDLAGRSTVEWAPFAIGKDSATGLLTLR